MFDRGEAEKSLLLRRPQGILFVLDRDHTKNDVKTMSKKAPQLGCHSKGQFLKIRYISKEVCRVLHLWTQMQCLSRKTDSPLGYTKTTVRIEPWLSFNYQRNYNSILPVAGLYLYCKSVKYITSLIFAAHNTILFSWLSFVVYVITKKDTPVLFLKLDSEAFVPLYFVKNSFSFIASNLITRLVGKVTFIPEVKSIFITSSLIMNVHGILEATESMPS